jgi:hypothetical protein
MASSLTVGREILVLDGVGSNPTSPASSPEGKTFGAFCFNNLKVLYWPHVRDA